MDSGVLPPRPKYSAIPGSHTAYPKIGSMRCRSSKGRNRHDQALKLHAPVLPVIEILPDCSAHKIYASGHEVYVQPGPGDGRFSKIY